MFSAWSLYHCSVSPVIPGDPTAIASQRWWQPSLAGLRWRLGLQLVPPASLGVPSGSNAAFPSPSLDASAPLRALDLQHFEAQNFGILRDRQSWPSISRSLSIADLTPPSVASHSPHKGRHGSSGSMKVAVNHCHRCRKKHGFPK